MSNPSKRHEEKAREITREYGPPIADMTIPLNRSARALTAAIVTALASAEAELLREMMEPSEAVREAGCEIHDDSDTIVAYRAMLTAAAKERGIELETVDAT